MSQHLKCLWIWGNGARPTRGIHAYLDSRYSRLFVALNEKCVFDFATASIVTISIINGQKIGFIRSDPPIKTIICLVLANRELATFKWIAWNRRCGASINKTCPFQFYFCTLNQILGNRNMDTNPVGTIISQFQRRAIQPVPNRVKCWKLRGGAKQ